MSKYIDADKVLDIYAELYDVFDDSKGIKKELHKVYDRLNEIPAADVQEIVKGEWIKDTGMAPPEFTGKYRCSCCWDYALMSMPIGSRQELSNFCSNCGADMRGEE